MQLIKNIQQNLTLTKYSLIKPTLKMELTIAKRLLTEHRMLIGSVIEKKSLLSAKNKTDILYNAEIIKKCKKDIEAINKELYIINSQNFVGYEK